jgi:ABC-type lipoprotein release transport system permease subunit
VGLALSISASRVLAERMEGMGTADPLLFLAVPALLAVATMAACFLPARSAVTIQPMEALRHD